jgi:hypothetical protein
MEKSAFSGERAALPVTRANWFSKGVFNITLGIRQVYMRWRTKSKKKPKRTLKWNHQADFIILLAALCALVIGVMGLVDAKQAKYDYDIAKNVTSNAARVYPVLHGPSTDFPLLAFGFATALAWISARKACFRSVSLDANYYLQRGVRQKDLSDIFEVKLPRWSWIKWRLRLWRSSLMFILQLGLYASIAICYRRAFQQGIDTVEIFMEDTGSQFVMGCPKSHEYGSDSFVNSFNWLMGVRDPRPENSDQQLNSMLRGAWDRSVGWGDEFQQTGFQYRATPLGAEGVFYGVHGWHGSIFAYNLNNWAIDPPEGTRIMGIQIDNFQGPFILGAVSLASNTTLPSDGPASPPDGNYTIEIMDHPTCGQLPQLCYTKPAENYMFVSPRSHICVWLGLAVENRTASISWNIEVSSSVFTDTNDQSVFNAEACPIRLDPIIYDSWLNGGIMTNATVVTNGTNLAGFWSYNALNFQTYFAALLGEVMETTNESLIIDKEVLMSNGLYMPPSIINATYADYDYGPGEPVINKVCTPSIVWRPFVSLEDKKKYGLPMYNGTLTYPAIKTNYLGYQTAAALLMILWGGILITIAYPFKNLLIKGSVNQFMSFGADLGPENMNGASLGHGGSRVKTIWRLRHRPVEVTEDEDELIWLERVDLEKVLDDDEDDAQPIMALESQDEEEFLTTQTQLRRSSTA